ncbi:hypothetical protein Plhal304r1_c019g0066591 [Plasmopara halstedii]
MEGAPKIASEPIDLLKLLQDLLLQRIKPHDRLKRSLSWPCNSACSEASVERCPRNTPKVVLSYETPSYISSDFKIVTDTSSLLVMRNGFTLDAFISFRTKTETTTRY